MLTAGCSWIILRSKKGVSRLPENGRHNITSPQRTLVGYDSLKQLQNTRISGAHRICSNCRTILTLPAYALEFAMNSCRNKYPEWNTVFAKTLWWHHNNLHIRESWITLKWQKYQKPKMSSWFDSTWNYLSWRTNLGWKLPSYFLFDETSTIMMQSYDAQCGIIICY